MAVAISAGATSAAHDGSVTTDSTSLDLHHRLSRSLASLSIVIDALSTATVTDALAIANATSADSDAHETAPSPPRAPHSVCTIAPADRWPRHPQSLMLWPLPALPLPPAMHTTIRSPLPLSRRDALAIANTTSADSDAHETAYVTASHPWTALRHLGRSSSSLPTVTDVLATDCPTPPVPTVINTTAASPPRACHRVCTVA